MKKQIHSILCILLFSCLFSGSVINAQKPYLWKSLPMGGGGFVSGIITSKQQQNLMYCRTDVSAAPATTPHTTNIKEEGLYLQTIFPSFMCIILSLREASSSLCVTIKNV